MKKKLISAVLAAGAAVLVLGVSQASAWQKDPDQIANAGSLTYLVTQLIAPDPTVGDADTTDPGIGTDAVGMEGDSLTAPPADPADADPGHTYFVDNHSASNDDCKFTTYTSIQDAVNASGPGDTVKVCPGTYREQVAIMGHSHDGLKLESVKPLQAVIKWPAVDTVTPASTPQPSHHLVEFNNADQVTFRGFKVTGPFNSTGCSTDRHEGLLVTNAFDEHIHHNWITMIQDSNPALYGCQQGDAVAIGWRNFGTAGSAHVDHNQVDEYQKNGVQAVNNGSSLRADHNVVTGSSNAAIRASIASNGFSIFNQAAATVDHNIVSNNQYAPIPLSTGIILDGAPSGSSEVDHNRVFGNDYGVETDTQNDLQISHNDVFQNLADAITLCGDTTKGCAAATGNVVQKNKVTNNGGSGILLLGADSNLLKSNQVENNGTGSADTTDGIRLDTNSSGNEILGNHLDGNVTHDCHDDSVGGGTASTANTWKGDKGETENRTGLCDAN
jgi:parallel beta-helix repeat protein